jgi:hypothetical protein
LKTREFSLGWSFGVNKKNKKKQIKAPHIFLYQSFDQRAQALHINTFKLQIYHLIMVQELSYTVTKNVLESWEHIRRMKNYEQVAGVKLFNKYVFHLLWFIISLIVN